MWYSTIKIKKDLVGPICIKTLSSKSNSGIYNARNRFNQITGIVKTSCIT